MDGRAVFRFAVEVVEQSIRQLLEREGLEGLAWSGVKVATKHTPISAAVAPARELAALDKLRGPALARQRYEMFRAMGQGPPGPAPPPPSLGRLPGCPQK